MVERVDRIGVRRSVGVLHKALVDAEHDARRNVDAALDIDDIWVQNTKKVDESSGLFQSCVGDHR